jgi:large subunit ribosomal protein L30
MADRLRVTQVKSTISHIARNRATIRAMGLKRIGHTVEIPDNPATRGMVRQVRFLVSVDEVSDAAPKRERAGHAAASAATTPSKDRADAPAGHPSEDSDSQEKA